MCTECTNWEIWRILRQWRTLKVGLRWCRVLFLEQLLHSVLLLLSLWIIWVLKQWTQLVWVFLLHTCYHDLASWLYLAFPLNWITVVPDIILYQLHKTSRNIFCMPDPKWAVQKLLCAPSLESLCKYDLRVSIQCLIRVNMLGLLLCMIK